LIIFITHFLERTIFPVCRCCLWGFAAAEHTSHSSDWDEASNYQFLT